MKICINSKLIHLIETRARAGGRIVIFPSASISNISIGGWGGGSFFKNIIITAAAAAARLFGNLHITVPCRAVFINFFSVNSGPVRAFTEGSGVKVFGRPKERKRLKYAPLSAPKYPIESFRGVKKSAGIN